MANPIGAFIQAAMSLGQQAVEQNAADETLQENFLQLNRSALREDALAVDTVRRGTFLGGQARMQGTRTVSQQKLAYEASGVDSTTGTPVQVGNATRMMSELDAQTIENNAAREALGHKQAASQYRDQWAQTVKQHDAEATARTFRTLNSFVNFIGSAGGS